MDNNDTSPDNRALFFAMFSFQIIDPKTWILASAVAATHAAQQQSSLVPLVTLVIIVPAGCLIAWSILGSVLGHLFHNRLTQRALSVAIALTFAAFAVILMVSD